MTRFLDKAIWPLDFTQFASDNEVKEGQEQKLVQPQDPLSPHLRLLRNSDEIVLAIDQEAKRVVGFITAITDHVLSAYISLLEVLPEYRGKGIGSELVDSMLERLGGLYMIDLICDQELQAFYAKPGMVEAKGMMMRNYENQSGAAVVRSR